MKLLLALLVLTSTTMAAPASKTETYLAELLARVAKASTPAALREILKAAPDGIKVSEFPVSDGSVSITLQFDPKDAAWLSSTWKLAKPYALAMDVHQRSWTIQLYAQDVADPYNKRIATNPIKLGRWTVWPRLAGRPKGALPKLAAGASPAYDLATYKASVVSLELTNH
ncbi:MAG: hypothetical protein ABI678_06330 [Kofleriaceae bacterium]